MLYKGKAIEVLGTKEVLGRTVAWIRILQTNEFIQVPEEDLEEPKSNFSLAQIKFTAIAAKIKDEVAKKNILAPYESSLIPLPHQILVLEKVMQSQQNRFLLADEVGMGKTIEAGLVLKELKLRGDINRILVIVPKSAMLQWQSELKEHFNEIFHIYDSELITSLTRTFSNINADQEFNFWEQHNQIIVSTDALKPLEKRQGWSQERVDEYNKFRMDAVLRANFDLVVIDEVHKMGGGSQNVSRYVLAQALCNTVSNVLLLSATPHRGKTDHFRRILQLLDPDAFDGEGLPDIEDLEPYVIRTEKRLAVDYEGKKLFNERRTIKFDVSLDPIKHARQLALYEAVTEYVRKGFNSASKKQNSATGLIMVLFQRLVSSSTQAILSAMEGRLNRLRYGTDSLDEYEDDLELSELDDILNTDGIYASPCGGLEDEESILVNLIEQAKECMSGETDAKAEAFLSKYDALRQELDDPDLKVLIFTEFRTTQRMLKDLLTRKGYRCSIINGSQELDERKKALTEFREQNQIMIATDAAGESLNMQFSHIIFNYDLPWNPMMIEQRIGRVDRIGQKKEVVAFNMLTSNSVDKRVYEVIEEKLTNIINQLGIDKTSDILDSTIDPKKVNKLYLQSLLDPSRFEFAGEKWLNEIKSKLKEYQATEGVLPEVREEEIEYKKASEVKYSPLPSWLEQLVIQYYLMKGHTVQIGVEGFLEVSIDGNKQRITFDPEVGLANPGIQNVTLQHDLIRNLLSDLVDFNALGGIPELSSSSDDDTTGFWSLWQISAQNTLDRRTTFQAYFMNDDKKIFTAYANDIWNRLLSNQNEFTLIGTYPFNDSLLNALNSTHIENYQQLEAEIIDIIEDRKDKRERSYLFQKSRLNKIGIKNIRESKLRRLESEHEKWLSEYMSNKKIIPGIKHLMTLRINAK